MVVSPLIDTWGGLRVIVRAYPRQEIRWHRKRRIAKKWRLRYGPKYRSLPVNEREILHDPQRGIIYCYPRMEAEIRALLHHMPPSPGGVYARP